MSVQLTVKGKTDVYITGKPSVTYFSSVYLRHSPFLKQYYEVPFDNLTLSGTMTATLPLYGDILTDITLKAVLPPLYSSPSLTTFYFPYQSVTVDLYVNYGDYAMFKTWNAGGYEYTTPSTSYATTATFSNYTAGNYVRATYTLSWNYTIYNNLITQTYNPSNQTFTFKCNPTIANYSDYYWYYDTNAQVPYAGYYFPNLPTGICFSDVLSAKFFGFPQAGVTYPFVNGVVTSNPIYTTGWLFGTGPGTSANAYQDSIGTAIINESRLKVGGTVVSTLPGSFLNVQYDTDVPLENQVALTQLVGKGDTTTVYFNRYTYTKLDFGLKNLALCALKRNDIQLEIDFSTSNILSVSALVEYMFVGDEERKKIEKNGQTYVFDSIYYKKFNLALGQNIIELNHFFKFPTKEIIIVAQEPGITYSSNVTNFILEFNGQELINSSSTLLTVIEPFETRVTMPSLTTYWYVFSGPINFSRISDIKLRLTASKGSMTCTVYTKCLGIFVARNQLGSILFV